MTITDFAQIFPTITLEVAFSTGAGDAGYLLFDDTARGKFDTATFGPAEYFVDLTAVDRLLSGSIQRGGQRFDGPYARADAGRATAKLDNSDRALDPTNLAGPYVAGGESQVQPMKVVRYRARWASVSYDLWRGFADGWELSYDLPSLAFTDLAATDGTKVIANNDGNAGGVVGTGETTGARIGRVLDNIGWPASDRALAAGKTTVQGTDLSRNAWAEIVLTADTELGEVYFDAAGRVVFRDRHAILTDTRSKTSQATFGDGPGELAWSAVTVANDDLQVKNLVRIARAGGSVQIVGPDATSKQKYQTRAWGRSDLLMQTDAEALDYAGWVLNMSKSAELRFATIEVDPLDDPDNLWPQVLGRELGDRVTVKLTPPGGGARISRDVFIRGIKHDFVKAARWKTTYALQDATTQFAFLIFDDATRGKLDSNAFAF